MAYEDSEYLERRQCRLKKIRRRRKIRRAKQAAFLALCIITLVVVYGKVTKKGVPFDQKPGNRGTPEAGSGKTPEGGEEAPEERSSLLGKVFTGTLPWYLTLVNEANPLPDGFTVEVSALKNKSLEFDSRAIASLQEMIAAGKSEGLSLIVCSAYRPMARQQELFQAEIDQSMAKGMSYEEAYQEAKTQVAIPGSSEHNLGLAADICSLDHQELNDAFADTPEAIWLADNAEKYGFILRYPKDKQDITGIIFEPWHFRYVGVEDAKEMKRLGFCLEEYVFYLAADKE